jgi:hypothetical protein
MKHIKLFEGLEYTINKKFRDIIEDTSELSDVKARQEFEKIKELLINDCPKFLDDIQNSQLVLRGCQHYDTDKIVEGMWSLVPHKNRTPKNTNKDVQELYDRVCREKVGTNVRSAGVFTSKIANQVSAYGKTHMFFPIGEYRCFWNDNVKDFYIELQSWDSYYYYCTGDEQTLFDYFGEPEDLDTEDLADWICERGDELIEDFKSTINDYVDEMIEGHIDVVTDEEMIFVCDEYYIVDVKYIQFFWEWLGISVTNLNENKLKHSNEFKF